MPFARAFDRILASGRVGRRRYAARWGLVEHWRLDEASGNRTGAYAGTVLTDTNTVTSAAGKTHATAAQFTSANSELLTVADSAALSTGDIDFWAAAWVYLDTKNADQILVAKASAENNAGWEFELFYDTSDDRFGMLVGDLTGAGAVPAVANTFGAVSTGAWHFVMGYFDSVNNRIGVSVNGGAFDTVDSSNRRPNDTNGAFRVGSGVTVGYTNGRIAQVSFGKSPALGIAAIANEIRNRLWNGGNGRAWPWP